MTASASPSTSSRLGLTSSLRVHHGVVVVLVVLVAFLAEGARGQDDPLEPWTPEPEFVASGTEVTAREGERAVLPCSIQNLGTKQVAWKRVDQEHFVAIGDMEWVRDSAISVDARQEELTDLTYWDLVFDPVRPEHAGTYECQITAKDKQSLLLKLKVVGPPVRKGLVLKGEKYVNLGQKILLNCTAHAGPNVLQDIDWFKDGNKLVSDSRRGVVITKFNSAKTKSIVSELIIDHSRASDTGTYICRSASDEIDSLKVTVLNANTTNVKRGHFLEADDKFHVTRSRYDETSYRSGQRKQQQQSAIVVLFLTSWTLLLWCLRWS
ncbi:zwei Ig domain protein zig-8-like isoform X2 [Babylonia areolata]|uniref:zwei Ig domain protein zig-8-like isoform X2 n=1 Tax=Babylonia areolata TaxID=304850 RepID=UPI003FCFE87B